MRRHAGWIVLAGALANGGCAVHFYDEETGKAHVLGLGLMSYRVDVDDHRVALVTQNRVAGVGAGYADRAVWTVVGYDSRTRLQVLDEDTCLRLEWPDGALVNVKVGSATPPALGAVACPEPEAVRERTNGE